jgi:hypothetical protein
MGAALLQAGCSGTAPGGTGDGPDADPIERDGGGDGGVLDSGIGLSFVTQPSLPADYSHNGNHIWLDEAHFTMVDLRLIGDSATGDQRTSKDLVQFDWAGDRSIPVDYPDAPPGMYSKVRATVAAYEVRGEVEIDGGDTYGLEIEDSASSVPIELPLEFVLEAGQSRQLEVEVDLRHMTEELPYDQIEVDEGSVEIEEGSDAMNQFIEKLGESFSVGNPSN